MKYSAFFRYILTQEEKSLLYQFLLAQKTHPKQNDWYSGVRTDLIEFDIYMNDEEIQKMPVNLFKNWLQKKQFLPALPTSK